MDPRRPPLEWFKGRLWREAAPVAALTVGLAAVAVGLQLLGRPYLLVFTMNVSMVTAVLTLLMYHRYRDWRILPLALVFLWLTVQQTLTSVTEVLSLSPPQWVIWLMASPLVVPTVLGLGAVVYLWRVFHVQADLQRREAQLEERARQAQKLESMGIMAGGIAHDFNTILTTISGNAALLQMDAPENSETAHHATRILEAAERAAAISRQMLDYTGTGKFRVEQIEIPRLIDSCRPLVESYVPDSIALHTHIDDDARLVVEGDGSQLQQVVINLVINAVEAIDGAGAIELRAQIVTATESLLTSGANSDPLTPGSYALLEVTDDGEGMDVDTRSRMFDPFFSTRDVGRGMGLAAVLGIVRGHHGTICVTSTPGKGTAVQVLLPVADNAAQGNDTIATGDHAE